MTPKQRACLDAIVRLTKNGVPPSYDELRVELRLKSKSGVHRFVQGLKDRGLIAHLPGRARSLSVASTEAESIDFDRLARAAINHALARSLTGRHPTPATMRTALVRAFRQGEAA